MEGQRISICIGIYEINVRAFTPLINYIFNSIGYTISKIYLLSLYMVTKGMTIFSQYPIKITKNILRKIFTDTFVILITRRQIQLCTCLKHLSIFAALGGDCGSGGGNGFCGKKELPERTRAIVAQVLDVIDFTNRILAGFPLQNLLSEGKLDTRLRLGHGGERGLLFGFFLKVEILGNGDGGEDAEDDQHRDDFDQRKTGPGGTHVHVFSCGL